MENSRLARLGRPLLTALTLLGSSALTVLPATSARADSFTSPTYCVLNDITQMCYASFTDAVKAATNNRVTDAPAVKPVNGSSDWTNLKLRMERANPTLSAFLFSDWNWDGKGILIVAKGGCQDATNPDYDPYLNNFLINGGKQKLYNYVTVNLNEVNNGVFDNKVESAIGLNKCAVAAGRDPNLTGAHVNATSAPNGMSSRFTNGVTSVRLFHNPTNAEVSKACDTAERAKREGWYPSLAVCTYNQISKTSATQVVHGGFQNNCGPLTATLTLGMEEWVANTNSYTTEVGQLARLEFEFGDLKAILEASVKEIIGTSVTTQFRVISSIAVPVPSGWRGYIDSHPDVDRYKVTAVATYPDGGPKKTVTYYVDQGRDSNTQSLASASAYVVPIPSNERPANCPTPAPYDRFESGEF